MTGAVDFQDALADFVASLNNPGVSTSTARRRAEDTLIPFRAVPVYHQIKFMKCGSGESEISDSAHAWPKARTSSTRIIPPRFDTVVVCQNDQCGQEMKGRLHSY